jgi:hypothetical protein
MIDHSKSLNSYRRELTVSLLLETESDQRAFGNPIYEFMT